MKGQLESSATRDATVRPTRRPVLLDLFCKAGGATKGYRRAGFYVIGVDCEPQPNYCGDEFVQMDALRYVQEECDRPVDAIHASPPCQGDLLGIKAVNRALGREYGHASLLDPVREILSRCGLPYVIEQPEQGAKMLNPVRLCGSSFGLPLRRHRLFESNVALLAPPCEHDRFREKRYWTSWVKNGERQRATVVQVYGNGGERHEWGPALGIDWMTYGELAQAIPPAYTEFLGRQLIAHIAARQAA